MRHTGKRVEKKKPDDSMDAMEWLLTIGVLVVAILVILYAVKDWGLLL